MYAITENPFDSGVLAHRVGFLQVEGEDAPAPPPRFLTEARESGYQLLIHQSVTPRSWPGVMNLGSTEELEGPIHLFQPAPDWSPHFDIASLSLVDLPAVEPLLGFAVPTRFSRDPNLSPETVRRHKYLNIEARTRGGPTYTALARSGEGTPLGFQCSYVRAACLVLYELMLRPQPLAGVLATELLLHNVFAVQSSQPEVTRLVTTIYRDNLSVGRFFTRLGLAATGRVHYHYHLWL